MADIHVLPAGLDPVALSRSYDALRQRLEAGDDLGDRRHHVRTLHASLEAAQRDLRHQIEAIRALPPMPGVDTEDLIQSIEAWAGALATCTTVIATQVARL